MDEGVRGVLARRLRVLVRRGTLDAYQVNEVVSVLLSEFGGDTASRPMDQCSPVGLIARAADASRVEVVAVNVASNDKAPVAVATIDWTRQDVIDAATLEADEAIVYTSSRMIKITAAGEVLAGLLTGAPAALALLSDAQSLNARISALEANYNAHTHGAVVPMPTPSSTSATLEGTDHLKEQR